MNTYENEGSIRVGTRYLCFPKYPEACSYVRIVDATDPPQELCYWCSDEWEQDPEDVMGAIIGALCAGIKCEAQE